MKRHAEPEAASRGDSRDRYSKPSKKLRKYTDDDAQLAHIFDNLASQEDKTRLTAATELIEKCTALFATRQQKSNGDGEEASAPPSESQVTTDLTKIHMRLVRGLCSSRKAARIGFSLALTEVYRLKLDIRGPSSQSLTEGVTNCLELIKVYTKPNDSHASGQVIQRTTSARSCLLNCASGEARLPHWAGIRV